MSTRGIIARPAGDSWEGIYHHWDSYPAGLGKALWDVYHGHFDHDAEAMLRVLIDEHRGGWSNIVDADWAMPIGFRDIKPMSGSVRCNLEAYQKWLAQEEKGGPQCYCHGDRQEGPYPLIGPDDDCGAEWCYILNTKSKMMAVLEAVTRENEHAVGMFGINPSKSKWLIRANVNLEGGEPDWMAIGC